MRERNEREKPQFSGLSRLLASLCDPYLSIVSVKIRHHALFLKIIEVTINSSTMWSPHPFLDWQLPTTRQTRRPRLAQLMLIQLGPRFFIRNKIIVILPHNLWSSHD